MDKKRTIKEQAELVREHWKNFPEGGCWFALDELLDLIDEARVVRPPDGNAGTILRFHDFKPNIGGWISDKLNIKHHCKYACCPKIK